MSSEEMKNRGLAMIAEGQALLKKAFEERPLPKTWKVGQRVRYLARREFAWGAGETGKVVSLRKEYRGKPAREYQVFYTRPDGYGDYESLFWTNPDDVELEEP